MKRLLFVVVVIVLAALAVAGTVSAAPFLQYTPDICVGGLAYASEEWPGGAPAAEAFDDSTAASSYWANNAASSGLPDWIAYDLGDGYAQVVAAYRIYFTNQDSSFGSYGYSPDTWQFQGSHDNATWDTLDSQSGQTWTADGWKQYAIANTTAYRYYRLYVTNTPDSNGWLAIHEIELLGGSGSPTPTPVVGDIIVEVTYPTPVPQYFDPTANAGDGPEPWLLRFYVGVFVVFAFTYVLFRFVDTHQFYLLFMALCMAAAWVTKSVNGAAYVYLFMLVLVLVLKVWGGLQRLAGFGQ